MSLFGFNNDPFFGGGHRNMMQQMDQMMTSMMRSPFEEDPFFAGAQAGPAFPSLMAPPTHPAHPAAAQRQVMNRQHRMSDPFAAMGMPNMNNIMESMMNGAGAGAGGHMYSSSSVMSMTTGPDGNPQVYQATSTNRGLPGGIREVRRTEADSRSNTRKMAVGHHIGDRGHVIERESRNGEMEEKQEFLNIDEEEAHRFNDEFRHEVQRHTGNAALEYSPRHRHNANRHSYASNVPAITNSNYSRRASPMLALTGGPSGGVSSGGVSRVRRRDREERGQRPSRRN
ncbi:unnamed protein product [Meganyctiphanes norvegica]|uniref:Myeloid leukemia factor n=1 Tax=Meganyctiphanes norvegica TaxID=48144 RepID=A0AAV2REL1_MEGNR